MLLDHGWAVAILLAAVFLAIGSFLNVLIHRLPIMLERDWRRHARELLEMPPEPSPEEGRFNLAVPGSRCPHCDHPVALRHNIPILSWLILRGRCPHCSSRISVQYPLVEAATAASGLFVVHVFGYDWLTAALIFYTSCLIALAFIDMQTQLLPDEITIPLLWCGVLTALATGHVSPADSIAGAAVGYLALWMVYWGFKLVTGREGMGHGDFKLLAALGAWLGWQALPSVVLMASLAGLVYAGVAILARSMRRDQPIPFGPFLALAGWVTLMFHEHLIAIT
ncbi:MAG: A24 family peptidase [Gammaproteobacteria bacterium]|nr:A24 family peptidase [Gammaproteobacteria bacterium]